MGVPTVWKTLLSAYIAPDGGPAAARAGKVAEPIRASDRSAIRKAVLFIAGCEAMSVECDQGDNIHTSRSVLVLFEIRSVSATDLALVLLLFLLGFL